MPTPRFLARRARGRHRRAVERHISRTLIGAALVASAATAFAPGAPVARASTTTLSGAFTGGPTPEASFESWRGQAAGIVNAFVAGGTWADIQISSSWASWWGKSAYASRMMITMPMLPSDTSTTLAQGATGAYDQYFVAAARQLVANGMGNATIRIGHEFNLKSPRWAAQSNPAAYAAYFRHIVAAMRSVPGQAFRFTWCPSAGYAGWDATTAYPGDAYVDVVSVDSYDSWYNHPATPQDRWTNIVTANKQGGLNFWASFAAAHNKPLGFAEWGLVNQSASMAAGGGGGDDPYYIQQMHDWIAAHNVAFESYFEKNATDGDHLLEGTEFPNAAAAYRSLWGAGWSTSSGTTSTSGGTTTSTGGTTSGGSTTTSTGGSTKGPKKKAPTA